MKFCSLKIQNFMRFKKAQVDLSNQGLTLILGDNRDASKASSNGSGKSAILDALCWALWGKTVRGLTHDDVVHEDVGKDCSVSVSFAEGSSVYEVVRYRKRSQGKPNDLYFYVDGEADESAAVAFTQDKINSVLGLDFETFQAMMPGAGVNVAELSDAGIKALLEKLLQTEVLAKAQELAKEELRALTKQHKLLEQEVGLAQADLNSVFERLSNYANLESNFAKTVAEQVEELDLSIEKTEIELKKIEEKEEELAFVKANLKELEADKAILAAELDKVEDKRTRVSEEHKNETRSILSDQRVVSAMLYSYKESLSVAESLTGSCPTCLQCVDEEQKNHVIRDLKKKIKEHEAEFAKLDRNANRSKEAARKDDVKYLKIYKSVQKQLVDFNDRFLNDSIRESNLTIEITEKPVFKRDLERLLKDRESLVTKASPYASLIEEEEKSKRSLEKKISKLELKLSSLAEEIKKYEFWVDGFSLAGIRNHMLSTITPILNQRAKHYSDLLTDGELTIEFQTHQKQKNGKLKEAFNIIVKQKNGSSSYKGISVGEKSRANLIIAFSLGDLAQMRAKKRIQFRFLDEPFENVDEAGHQEIVKLLHEQETQYDSVFCITHKESFQSMFSKSLTVVKEDGFSRIEVSDG